MKNLIITCTLLFLTQFCFAQTPTHKVVRLKNGEKINVKSIKKLGSKYAVLEITPNQYDTIEAHLVEAIDNKKVKHASDPLPVDFNYKFYHEKQVVVTLHDGSRIKGELVNYEMGKSCTILEDDKQVHKIAHNDISKFKEYKPTEEQTQEYKKQKHSFKQKKRLHILRSNSWYKLARLQLGSGKIYNDEINFSSGLDISGGYVFTPKLMLGVGVGIHLATQERGEQVIPTFVEIRSIWSKEQKIRFFTDVQLGYTHALKSEKYGIINAVGGLMAHPSAGIIVQGLDGRSLIVDLGIRFQYYEVERLINRRNSFTFFPPSSSTQRENIEHRTYNMNRLTFRVGLIF